jgi:Pvc16 N-terminal domain
MFSHIRAASLSLQNVLQRSLRADPTLAQMFDPALGGTAIVSLATPEGMETAHDIGLSVWLYRLIRDEQTLNQPPRRVSPTLIRRQALPVCAHYMITPIIMGDAGMPAPEAEQLIIGRVLQTFNDEPLISGPDLAGSYQGTDVELAVRLEMLGLDETSRIWEGLKRSYQLSVSYEVAIVVIGSALEAISAPPVRVAMAEVAIGAPPGGAP